MPDDRAPEEQPWELPAPYELEAPVDDVALLGAALGVAALVLVLLAALLPALGLVGWLVAVTGLAVSGLSLRRGTPGRRAARTGALLSAAALLVALVLAVVAALTALVRVTGS
ncbi:hypothetical protein FHN55_02665 [Streptomyces sp. NP160]|uniref:hypothetical protein n=1 Tax=Streptomyces sp. NP160 TaxID=2586637 RepID=UPI0011198864|nr:hypothetical protein [Streptomyces sp. NP160]TNM69669.1 hypothetical protein FHN55_02665 [Streptomyces sp. NP160]